MRNWIFDREEEDDCFYYIRTCPYCGGREHTCKSDPMCLFCGRSVGIEDGKVKLTDKEDRK